MTLSLTPDQIVEKGEYPLLVIASHWERVHLENVAKVQNGFAFKSELFDREKGVPLIRIRDVKSETTEHRYTGEFDEEYIVQRGGIIVGMDGDFKAARWRGNDALLNQRVCRLTLFSKAMDERFFFLCLQPYLDAINAETSSVTVKHLSSKSVQRIPLPLPPLNEQRRIVAKIEELFTELDSGVESLKRARELLKLYRQSVLKHAFEGKLTADWREANKDKLGGMSEMPATWTHAPQGKPKSSKAQRKSKRSTDGLSDLPKGWAEAELSEIVAVNPGIDKSAIDPDSKVSFVPMSAVEAETGRIALTEEKAFSKVRTGYTPFLEGDVLFAKITPCMENGKMAVVPELPYDIGFGSTEFHVLRCPEGVDPKYIYYHVSSAGFRHDAEHNMAGAVGQKRVPAPYLSACIVPLAPFNEQRQIVAEIEQALSKADYLASTIDNELARVKVLCQSILKKAFSGQLVPQDPADKPASALLARIKAGQS